MAGKPQGIPAMVLVLTLICAVMAGALSAVNSLTRERILEQERQYKLKSIKAVLPAYDNQPLEDALTVTAADGTEVTVNRARKSGELVGVAFEMSDPAGYGGNIRVLIGLLPSGEISGIEIIEHKETPGLGSLVTTSEWRKQFQGRSMGNTKWAVDKDGGDINAITGATISPRAVTAAVKRGLELFEENKEAILRHE